MPDRLAEGREPPKPWRSKRGCGKTSLLGGSWIVISRVISRVTIPIIHIRGLITPLITTHEPPSRVCSLGFTVWRLGFRAYTGILRLPRV